MSRVIALMTDFGNTDIYTGVIKAVIHRICPQANVIDITHSIQPHHVRQAAFALLDAYRYFADGTIFLVVVDPGVGTTRRPIAARAGNYIFVAPDNGILTYVLAEFEHIEVVELASRDHQLPQVSNTFHARDIFAPAAAYLAAGAVLEDFGPYIETIFTLPVPSFDILERRILGEVMHVDQFGNIVTSIGQFQWMTPEKLTLNPRFGADRERLIPIPAGEVTVTVHDTLIKAILPAYGEAPRGQLLALIGSNGHLEIAVNQGNAAARLDVRIGDRVELQIGVSDAAVRD
jgi:S-adenosylmethionine hydrolase